MKEKSYRAGRRPKGEGKKPGRKYSQAAWTYLSPEEHDVLVEAARIVGRSRSQFCADAIMEAAYETIRIYNRGRAANDSAHPKKKS